MGRVGDRFKTILSRGDKAFIPYFTAQYPDPQRFKQILLNISQAGADFIEIGIPFSDPLADGKTIQYSSQWVLERGFNLSRFFEDLDELKGKLDSSLILMLYYNSILQRGLERFGEDLEKNNITGVVVPDLPLEENQNLLRVLSNRDIDLIPLIAPTTSLPRAEKICRINHGFVYLVSLTGVTGIRHKIPDNLTSYIKKIRNITSAPLCVGFGVSTPAQAKAVANKCDGVIIGSALINVLRGREEQNMAMRELELLLKDLRKSI